MITDTHAWLAGLRAHAAAHRDHRPPPADGPLLPVAVAERAILATDLTTRLATLGHLLAARMAAVRSGGHPVDPEPAIVITTSFIGIAVVAELLAAPMRGLQPLAARIAAVTELEYRLWCIRHPDDDWTRHVNLWSWVKTRVPGQRQAEFARHPLGPGEAYWLHRAGVCGAGAADTRHCHLWKWNGRHASLLQAFVREGSVGHLRPQGGGGGTV